MGLWYYLGEADLEKSEDLATMYLKTAAELGDMEAKTILMRLDEGDILDSSVLEFKERPVTVSNSSRPAKMSNHTEYLRSVAPRGFDFFEMIERPCIDLGFWICLADGKFSDVEANALQIALNELFTREISFVEFLNNTYLSKLSEISPIDLSSRLRSRVTSLVSEANDTIEAGSHVKLFLEDFAMLLAIIVAIDGKIEENEVGLLKVIIRGLGLDEEYLGQVINMLPELASKYSS